MRRQELHPRTAIINKTQKNLSKKARCEALQWLALNFPQAFDTETTLCIRPLKIGIIDDILEHADKAQEAGISRSKLREAVVLFTRRIDYLTCLKAREPRVDLYGNPVDITTEDDAEKASQKIKKKIEKSARNARKVHFVKGPNQFGTRVAAKLAAMQEAGVSKTVDPHYIERPPLYSTPAPVRSATVVMRKTARSYDPAAIARLKEKLGLSRKAELMQETAE